MHNINNQRGLSSILFATIFALVLSLLAVGFATLLRNDSRQTFDQTIGYQAQYAAESGVNQAAEKIKSSQTEQKKCETFDVGVASDQVKVTCVTWAKAPDVQFSDLTNKPQPFKMDLLPPYANSFIFDWKLQTDPGVNTGTGFDTYASTTSLPNPIDNNHMPILKVTMLKSGESKQHNFYFVPTTTANVNTAGAGDYAASGTIYPANCTSTACTFELGGIGSSFDNGYMAVSVIGRNADDLVIKTDTGSFNGVQWQVDSTAVALDITKRVQARVDPVGATWRPGNTVSTDEICKDIKVDGINGTTISGDSSATNCATRLKTP